MEKSKFCNTLLDCPARFAGLYGKQYIKQFTEFIQAYKKIKHIPDEQALEELIHLLTSHAYNWWRRRQRLFKTWSEALTALTAQFCKRRPAYLIYADLFQCNQQSFDDDKKLVDFINDKIELIYELSEQELNNQMEARHFHMIWALLPPEKRSHFESLHINTINELMEYLNENVNMKRKYSNYNRDKKHLTHHNNGESNHNKDRNGPIIKVKRTADLMPIINKITKQTENGNGNVIGNANGNVNGNKNMNGNGIVITTATTNDNANVSFYQRDTDTTEQITCILDTNDKQTLTKPTSMTSMTRVNSLVIDDDHIDINDYDDDDYNDEDINEDDGESNDDEDYDDDDIDDDDISLDASPKMPQITYLLNGETTIAPELPSLSLQKLNNQNSSKYNKHPQQQEQQQQQQQTHKELSSKEKRIKVRCGFCRNAGHRSVECTKKIKYTNLHTERCKTNDGKGNKLSKPNKTIKDALVLNKEFILNDNVIVSTISNKIPSNTSISLQQIGTQKNCHNNNNNNNNTSNSNSNSISNNINTTIRTLIKPINGQTSSKPNSKIVHRKNNTDSNSKCHQCGAVGYYRSICPNCSPIYYYKPLATSSLSLSIPTSSSSLSSQTQ